MVIGLKSPRSLYSMCLELFVSLMQNLTEPYEKLYSQCVDNLAPSIVEDALILATTSARQWKHEWSLLLTPSIRSAVISDKSQVLELINDKCKALRQVLFLPLSSKFDLNLVLSLPKHVVSVDFNGELFYRHREVSSVFIQSLQQDTSSWIPEAEKILRSMLIWRQKVPDFINDFKCQSLVELHLGTVKINHSDIQNIVQSSPKLRILRHYQLVSALYEMHLDDWKQGLQLPQYKLRNLDADFSHVVRSQMAPKRVLPVDALQLATRLCPDATLIRIRFDCSTHHESIAGLMGLKRLKELSMVRVTDGERCLLDFTDIVPLLEKFGAHLALLELKVIEDIDTHKIVETCSRLEALILSGCSYVFPDPTCETSCLTISPSAQPTFPRLRFFFYADGDDFSPDHSLPQCFWKCILSKSQSKYHQNKLQALFLEAPRISEQTALEVFTEEQTLPDLQVLSICRYNEISLDQLISLITPQLLYLKISQCDQFSSSHITRLKHSIKNHNLVLSFDK